MILWLSFHLNPKEFSFTPYLSWQKDCHKLAFWKIYSHWRLFQGIGQIPWTSAKLFPSHKHSLTSKKKKRLVTSDWKPEGRDLNHSNTLKTDSVVIANFSRMIMDQIDIRTMHITLALHDSNWNWDGLPRYWRWSSTSIAYSMPMWLECYLPSNYCHLKNH